MKFQGIHIVVILLGLSLQFESCIDAYEPVLNVSDTLSILVVDGNITDNIGPFRVKLSKSVPVGKLIKPTPVLGAEVVILDDSGNIYQLFGDSLGVYETPNKNLSGIPGRTYTLHIMDKDGFWYESAPVFMSEVPEIKRLYFEEKTKWKYYGEDVHEEKYLEIFADVKNLGNQIDYWKWEFEETWEINLPLSVKVDANYIGVNIPSSLVRCWVSEASSSLIVQSSAGTSEGGITKVRIMSVGPADDRLLHKYSVLVKQYAINNDVYHYLKKLYESNFGTAGLYSIRPSGVFGNVYCCNNDNKVLGYFSASCEKTKRLFINPSEHSVKAKSPYDRCRYKDDGSDYYARYFYGYTDGGKEVFCDSWFCQSCLARGTNKRPDFW